MVESECPESTVESFFPTLGEWGKWGNSSFIFFPTGTQHPPPVCFFFYFIFLFSPSALSFFFFSLLLFFTLLSLSPLHSLPLHAHTSHHAVLHRHAPGHGLACLQACPLHLETRPLCRPGRHPPHKALHQRRVHRLKDQQVDRAPQPCKSHLFVISFIVHLIP